MDIKIIKNIEEFNRQLLNDNLLLEISESNSDREGIKKDIVNIYDLSEHSRYEILPKIIKYNLGKIYNVSCSSDYLYFFSVSEDDKDNSLSKISIIRYNYVTMEMESILTFSDDIVIYDESKQLKVFVLNDMYLIVQHEYLRESLGGNYQGFFDFELKLYNIKDNTFYNIVDDNLVNNGIETIIPITETQCIIKTGFSLLKDNRHNLLTKEETSLESISFVNISQLVSDMLINKTNISFDTIDQAFYEKTFPYISKKGDFLIYSCVDFTTKEEEVIFYNYITKETKNCINKNVVRPSDLVTTYIIDNDPFICLKKENEISFFNLRTSKISLTFDNDNTFVDIINDTFIFKGRTKKTLFKNSKPFFELINYPQKNVILHENSEFIGCLSPDKDNLYIFVK